MSNYYIYSGTPGPNAANYPEPDYIWLNTAGSNSNWNQDLVGSSTGVNQIVVDTGNGTSAGNTSYIMKGGDFNITVVSGYSGGNGSTSPDASFYSSSSSQTITMDVQAAAPGVNLYSLSSNNFTSAPAENVTVTVADNASIGDITHRGSGPLTVNSGDNASFVQVNGGSGNDVITFGDNNTVRGMDLAGGNDTVNVGANFQVPTSGGTFDQTQIEGQSGTDTFNITNGYYSYYNGSTYVLIENDQQLQQALQDNKALYASDENGTPLSPSSSSVTPRSFEAGGVVCFAAGTMIATETGQVAIEDLAEGDMIFTKDNGYQALRWIGSRKLSAADLAAAPKLRPIRIKAGALGKNIPATDLVVSPQHRILVRSKIAQKIFGTNEVLVAAKQLCQIDGIDIAEDLAEVEYFHMLFDRHEVVLSNGAETESLYTGPEALKSLGQAALDEIFAIFPELKDRDYAPESARRLASGRLGRKLAVRHIQNEKALVNE